MKWALVVYFLVNGTWQTAESLKYDGWYRMHFDTKEECIVLKTELDVTRDGNWDTVYYQCRPYRSLEA